RGTRRPGRNWSSSTTCTPHIPGPPRTRPGRPRGGSRFAPSVDSFPFLAVLPSTGRRRPPPRGDVRWEVPTRTSPDSTYPGEVRRRRRRGFIASAKVDEQVNGGAGGRPAGVRIEVETPPPAANPRLSRPPSGSRYRSTPGSAIP